MPKPSTAGMVSAAQTGAVMINHTRIGGETSSKRRANPRCGDVAMDA